MKQGRWMLALGAFVLLADLASKYVTQVYLPLMRYGSLLYPYGGIGVFKDFLGIQFSLNHQVNRGAAWGVLADFQTYLLCLRIVLVILLIVYTVFFNKHTSWKIPLTLVIAGAFGNIIDYFFYGHVVDMLHFVFWGYEFPVFNIADVSIFIGISSLVFMSCFFDNKTSQGNTGDG